MGRGAGTVSFPFSKRKPWPWISRGEEASASIRRPLPWGVWASHVIDQATKFQRPIVLVGHSLGGITLTEVARRNWLPIVRLVFVSCLIPREGETTARCIAGDQWQSLFRSTGDFVPPEPAICRQLLGNDMDEADTAEILSGVQSEPAGPLLSPITRKGMPDLPRTYVRLRPGCRHSATAAGGDDR